MERIPRSKEISREAKIVIYKKMIKPEASYASEVWTLTKKQQNTVEVWKRRVLRKVFGSKIADKVLIRGINGKLIELYKHPILVGVIKERRQKWLRYVERTSGMRVPKKTLPQEILIKKRRRKPRSKWKYKVEVDLQTIGFENGRMKRPTKKLEEY